MFIDRFWLRFGTHPAIYLRISHAEIRSVLDGEATGNYRRPCQLLGYAMGHSMGQYIVHNDSLVRLKLCRKYPNDRNGLVRIDRWGETVSNCGAILHALGVNRAHWKFSPWLSWWCVSRYVYVYACRLLVKYIKHNGARDKTCFVLVLYIRGLIKIFDWDKFFFYIVTFVSDICWKYWMLTWSIQLSRSQGSNA